MNFKTGERRQDRNAQIPLFSQRRIIPLQRQSPPQRRKTRETASAQPDTALEDTALIFPEKIAKINEETAKKTSKEFIVHALSFTLYL